MDVIYVNGYKSRCRVCNKVDCIQKKDKLLNIIVDFNRNQLIFDATDDISNYVFICDESIYPTIFNVRGNYLYIQARRIKNYDKYSYRHDFKNGFVYIVRSEYSDIQIDNIMIEFEKWFKDVKGVKYNNQSGNPFQYIPRNKKKLVEYKKWIETYNTLRFNLLEALVEPKCIIHN